MYIIAADTIVDGVGDLSATAAAVEKLQADGVRVVEFEISSSTDGWLTELPENRLRCACAPLIAINKGRKMMAAGETDTIVIRGREHLKSDFVGRKEERNRLMQIYGEGKGAILDGYEQLAQAFLAHWNISPEDFRRTSVGIFENHWRVWQAQHTEAPRPADTWFDQVTPMFRGVDCANPSVDFDGCLVMVSDEVLRTTDFGQPGYSRVAGCDVQQQTEDGPEYVDQIVSYHHIKASYENACQQAGIDFSDLYLHDRALLDIYTCYSVVPMGFLLATGLVESFDEIPDFVASHPLTVTGGLNLLKAPWNNTTVQTLAIMFQALKTKGAPEIAGIHSVGALGYLQGFTILQEISASDIG
jgi:hypothetical protein